MNLAGMQRRDVLGVLSSSAAAPILVPLVARAQQRAVQVIGLLNVQSSSVTTNYLAAFRQSLAGAGFVEGRNLAIVYRSAEGIIERLPALAAELVNLQVSAIAAVGGDYSVLSAEAATKTIPIVFTTGGDPVEIGIVPSLNRPGGNVTGVTALSSLLVPKQIGLLRDLVPGLATIGLLVNPTNRMTPSVAREVEAAVLSVRLKMVLVEASAEGDFDSAFAQFVEQQVEALIVAGSADFNRESAADGGMMSYGADFKDAYRQAGIYVGRILKGDKPADLPVMQPTKFELVINMQAVRALGLTVPPGLLAIADEVIE